MNEYEPLDDNGEYYGLKPKRKGKWGPIIAVLVSLAACAFVVMLRARTASRTSAEPTSLAPITTEPNITEVVVIHTTTPGPPPEGVDVGLTAPDFTLNTIDGEPLTLSSLRGKTVLLNFWATWCPPCREEMPAFQKVYEEFKDDDFTIVSITDEAGSELDKVFAFREEYGLTFTILLDEYGTINERYYIYALPRTLLLTPEGVVHKILLGGITEDRLRRELAVLLP
jgi:peroxiredoxin